MCCAQTAAPKGKKHKRWEMEQRSHRSVKSNTRRSARSVVGSVAPKQPGKLPDMLLHETAVAWLRWKMQPSTPACLWEETREVKRKHQSTLEKWAYTDGTVQYFDRTDAEAEERKRGMQEACRQVSRLQQKLHNPCQRLHEPSEIKA